MLSVLFSPLSSGSSLASPLSSAASGALPRRLLGTPSGSYPWTPSRRPSHTRRWGHLFPAFPRFSPVARPRVRPSAGSCLRLHHFFLSLVSSWASQAPGLRPASRVAIWRRAPSSAGFGRGSLCHRGSNDTSETPLDPARSRLPDGLVRGMPVSTGHLAPAKIEPWTSRSAVRDPWL